MKKIIPSILLTTQVLSLFGCGSSVDPNAPVDDTIIRHDLTPLADSDIVLNNPHKGIYQHYYDNVNSDAYYGGTEEEILSIPGINHLFVRMAWSYLEPFDNVYDFSLIDNLINTYKKYNITISLDITCKETGIRYATPQWVEEKGAVGTLEGGGMGQWKPKYNDPIFLEYLERFHTKMNDYYKDETAIENITMGSIGDWGEGHSYFSGGEFQTLETLKTHIDLFKKCYPNRQIVIGDDYLRSNMDNNTERQTILNYCVENNVGMRDDSILVQWQADNFEDSVANPEYFDAIAPVAPTTIECEHYSTMKDNGYISGPDGSIKGKKELFGAIDKIHATYFSFHGSIFMWLADNPNLTKEIANKVGYWYYMNEVLAPKETKHGKTYDFTVNVSNYGAARAYNPYDFVFRFENSKGEYKDTTIASLNETWLPDQTYANKYSVTIPEDLKADNYVLKIGMKAENGRSVLFALNDDLKDANNFYKITDMVVR